MSAITSINPEPAEIPNNKLIDRRLIEGYCSEKNINVHRLLLDIVKSGSADLSDFVASQGGQEIANKSKGVLHGSFTLFDEFEPRVSTGGPNENKNEPLVYATDIPDFAMFLAVTHRLSGSSGVSFKNGEMTCYVDREFINGPSKIDDGYVYVLDENLFDGDKRGHLTSPHAQEPMMIIPVKPEDLQTQIKIDLSDD